MSTKVWTAEECMQAAIDYCETEDPKELLGFLVEEYAGVRTQILGMHEDCERLQGLFDTVVACLVGQLGGEARISRACIEDPPPLGEDDDPITGEWIYTTKSEGS